MPDNPSSTASESPKASAPLDYDILAQNKRVIKKDLFQYKQQPYVVGGAEKEPLVTVIKNKDVVTGIEVKCTCGRKIHIECN